MCCHKMHYLPAKFETLPPNTAQDKFSEDGLQEHWVTGRQGAEECQLQSQG